MTEPIDVRERRSICDLLVELGPDAPTLCEGWTTADLAAHLVLREHFHRWSDAQRAAEKAKGYPAIIARLRAGAPLVPWRIPRIRNVFNGLEYFIHNEDARRANGHGPRPQADDLEALSWRMIGYTARRIARRIRPFGLALVLPDGRRRTYGSGTVATLTGPASELVLYLSGRRATAQVTLTGDADATAAVERADLKV
ncbi:MAG TPA: TIGR03085 family metal-binding protein [Candidatus Dormibacteraeota bacterium]